MANRKMEKIQTMVHKTQQRKQKIYQHDNLKNRGWTRVLRKGRQFLLT